MNFIKTQKHHTRLPYLVIVLLLSINVHAQSWQWVKSGGSASNPSNSNPQSELVRFLETDNNGNVYMASPVTQFVTVDGNAKTGYGGSDYVLASFACDGTYRWSTIIGGHDFSDEINSIKVDNNGDVYVTLRASFSADQFQELFHFDPFTTIPSSNVNAKKMYLAKYNGTTGNVIWYKAAQADGLTSVQASQSSFRNFFIDVDGTLIILARLIQGIYFNGQFNNTAAGTNNFIIKFAANGDFVSSVQIATEMEFGDFSLRHPFQFLKHPTNGKYYIYAGFISYNGVEPPDVEKTKILRLSSTGVVEWQKTITSPTIGSFFESFEIGSDGSLYAGGSSRPGNSFGSYAFTSTADQFPFLLKLDPDGNVIWGTNATITPAGAPHCNVVHVKGNEVAVSPYWHNITWGGSYPSIPNAGTDASLYIFDKTTGAFINNTRMSSLGGTEGLSVMKTDVFGNLVVGGYFDFNVSAGSTNAYSVGGGSDFFVAKYGANNGNCALATVEQSAIEKVMVYPNPATTEIFINTQEKISYVIYNVLGKKVANGELENTTTPIAVSHLANGSYVINIKNSVGEVKKVKFMKR